MTAVTFALLIIAGVGTGLVGYLTGLASLVSYPALLAAGLSPVAANVSNTLGLVGVGVGATARAAGTVFAHGARPLIPEVSVALAGGLAGAVLLLVGDERVFAAVVPVLIAASSVALLFSPRLRRMRAHPDHRGAYLTGLFAVSVYGGYFGAGAGVIYLALSMLATSESFGRAMVLKSLLLGVTNLVAAGVFIAFGPVDWLAALALGLGCLLGGNLGPAVQRHLPEPLLRGTVVVCGLGLAVWLARR